MISSFTWLDYSERDRSRALDVIDLFRETGTVDELGIGTIRDSFSDLLFPGTSTIQTRACYFLLLPWTYLRIERLRISSSQVAERARREELSLNERLLQGPDTEGVFGSSAGKTLKRLPSVAYWGGLGTWGIRVFAGHIDAYYRSLDGFYRRVDHLSQVPTDPEGRREAAANWHPHVPAPPKSFPYDVSVALRRQDSEYLVDRIAALHSGSLLAELAARPDSDTLDVDWPWDLAGMEGLASRVCEQLEHGELFAVTFHGAALLYNLMLAEASEWRERVDFFREELDTWFAEMRAVADRFASWDLERFWSVVAQADRRVAYPTRLFVEQWIGHLRRLTAFERLPEQSSARSLIRERELRLKGGRARLHSPRHLELWGGASGSDKMNYRWSDSRRILTDIFAGLDRAEDDA